ncbi:hypothetical protein RZS08_27905, partial [Arthrospira platensis SPKY1]|nr:hypothetical protein [Arthrospira platensis SPKY1]
MNREGAAAPCDPLTWDERLESGVLAIDLQHRVLFQLLQRVGEAGGDDPSTRLAEVLSQLRAYADYHFRYEE